MKKGYKRLLIFEIILFIILILNNFVSNILVNYIFIIFLLIITLLFKLFFGFEKPRRRYVKDIIIEILIFLILFYLIYYIFGLIIGYAKVPTYYSINGFFKVILPLVLSIIIKEFLRYNMLSKAEGNKLLLILTCILFIILDVKDKFYGTSFTSSYETFEFVALTLLPAISINIVCSYITTKVGYIPVIIYLCIWKLFNLLIPVIPDPNNYLYSIINLIIPVIMCYRIYLVFQKTKDDYTESRYKNIKFVNLIFPTIVITLLVYFTSGYFKYNVLAIASGSMEPFIKVGDIVIVNQIKDENYDFNSIKEGQIIAYKKNNIIVVHRIAEKIKLDNQYCFYTKGDANENLDNFKITQDMIVGTVDFHLPYLGYPAVWLNNLID